MTDSTTTFVIGLTSNRAAGLAGLAASATASIVASAAISAAASVTATATAAAAASAGAVAAGSATASSPENAATAVAAAITVSAAPLPSAAAFAFTRARVSRRRGVASTTRRPRLQCAEFGRAAVFSCAVSRAASGSISLLSGRGAL
uniref:Uncharacterized protein n=1 Tax=Haptolina brevifila TaxID=156173 RepID=A0A7S2INF9_9EUKA